MMLRALFTSAIPSVFAVLTGVSAFGAPLPGGASSLVETYQDWVVVCQAQGEDTGCVMRQVQNNNQTGQHVLTAEFHKTADGTLDGVLLLPFGLALAPGVSLKVDDAASGTQLAFFTPLPTGCVLPVDADLVRAGAVLNIAATAAAPAQPVAFKISLSGFSAALNRMTELTK